MASTLPELLRKKRDGHALSGGELRWLCEEVAAERVGDSQIGAMLMAMFLQGMSREEMVHLTRSMVETGDQLEWDPDWPLVDKHSTGGVGDKVSIAMAPAVAALGLKVPMLSGRALGYTGGTLDKLESIPGFKVQNTFEELKKALATAGCFIAGPTGNLVPVDKKFYAIRDVTSTVESIPLIVGSIISKKVAGGANALVMDVKVGKATFLKTVDEVQKLGEELIYCGEHLGVSTKAVLTEMDNPIGRGIGNALEIEEAVNCMRGLGPPDLEELVAVSGGLMLQMKNMASDLEEGKAKMREVLRNGKALETFSTMLQCQGVSKKTAEELCNGDMRKVLSAVPLSQITRLEIKKSGMIHSINAMDIGVAVWKLGAGRSAPGQEIDHRVGVRLLKVVGDTVIQGDNWIEIHHGTPKLPPEIRILIESAIDIGTPKSMSLSRVIKIL